MKAWDMRAYKAKPTATNAMMSDSFSISGSSQPTQVLKNYQQIDVASGGLYGSALKASQSKPRSSVVMMAKKGGDGDKKSPFMDFKCGMLDDSGEKTMAELCKDKKAILIVNVASE